MINGLEHHVYHPETRRFEHPLLLLHGAWHGAWCWDAVIPSLTERGWEVHTMSWRGHGTSHMPKWFNLVGIKDYTADLKAVVDSISPRPIVMGHSMGGAAVQQLLKTEQLPGAVLLASVPVNGTLKFTLRYTLRHPLRALWSTISLNGKAVMDSPELIREYFLRSTESLETATALQKRITAEPIRLIHEMGLWSGKPKQNRTPLLVIAAERDGFFTVAEEQKTATAYGVECHVLPEAAHDLMLDPAWPQVVELLEQAAQTWGLALAEQTVLA